MFFTFLFAWLFAAVIIYLWCYIVEVVLDLPVSGQTPCTAHASLKNIIRRVLRDASNIAILKKPQSEAESPDTTPNRTYEDLLATAILNKVIDNYQSDLRRSSSGSSSSKRSESTKKHKSKKQENDRWRSSVENPDLDTTSISSVEEWCRSESSCGSKYVDHMSFTIHQSIEEITTSDDDHPNNKYLHSHNLSRNSLRDSNKEKNLYKEDWQDNWLFSRKGKGSPKPVPVPMLVPNPSTDYRALIGDRDAEDTSDLSETGSDLEESDSVQDIKTILIDSRTIIGGKNLLENINADSEGVEDINVEEDLINTEVELMEDSIVAETNKNSSVDSGVDDLVSEARNNVLIHETQYEESDSLSSNTEKDMEYTEKYASIPRQISKDKKSPMPSPRTSKNSINDQERDELIKQNNDTETNEQIESDEENDEQSPIVIKGSYSEKEKEKWRNPVALSNNPYSKENLDKRLHNKSTLNGNFAFGRDYYVREAKKASGGRKKFLDDDDTQTESSGHDFEEVTENPDSVDQNIFTALPAVIQEEEDIDEANDDLTDLESVPASRPVSLALSTDSEDVDVKRVYNIETGKVTKYKNKPFTKEVIEDSKSPEGTKYIINSNELISSNLADEVNNKFDENHNQTEDKKQREPIMNISKLNHILNIKVDQPKESISKSEFLQQQISIDEPEIEILLQEVSNAGNSTPEMRDISKKYLQSLVKNNSKNMLNINVSTPPISLHEDNSNSFKETSKSDEGYETINNEITPPISLQEDITGNLIDIEVTDTYDIDINHKSCIDLRFIEQNNVSPIKPQISVENSFTQNRNGFASSTPNLTEEKLYYSDEDDNINEKKSSDLDELITINKPSVRDLKKLFDQDKAAKSNILRSKSHLTTKPEFRAHRQVHSLTARSLSKEFRRDKLPELQRVTDTNDVIIESNGVEEEIKVDQTEEVEELKSIPPCKSKIQFFELLKNKN